MTISPPLFIASAMLVAVTLYGCSHSRADAFNFSPTLKSKKAVCCNDFDGHPPVDWELSDGTVPNVHYRVQIEGEWVNVPDDAVLDVPNKAGIAVVWYSVSRLGMEGAKPKNSFFIRCFLPGSLSLIDPERTFASLQQE